MLQRGGGWDRALAWPLQERKCFIYTKSQYLKWKMPVMTSQSNTQCYVQNTILQLDLCKVIVAGCLITVLTSLPQERHQLLCSDSQNRIANFHHDFCFFSPLWFILTEGWQTSPADIFSTCQIKLKQFGWRDRIPGKRINTWPLLRGSEFYQYVLEHLSLQSPVNLHLTKSWTDLGVDTEYTID